MSLSRIAAVAWPLALLATPAPAQNPISMASVDSSGVPGRGRSGTSSRPVLSADGRFVAFDSEADNLVAGDGNHVVDVFVHEFATGKTVRVSVSSAGVEGDDWSREPSLSQDGRFVAFTSRASNLIANDATTAEDVYLHDRDPDGNGVYDEGNGVTTLVSVSSSGVQGASGAKLPSISADGSKIAFESFSSNLVSGDTNLAYDVFVRDLIAQTTERVSVSSTGAQGDLSSFEPSLSGDGTLVAFVSAATTLVAGDTNHSSDVFVRDRVTPKTTRVSVDSSGAQVSAGGYDGAISADGTTVVFASGAVKLVPNDLNGVIDVFAHDLATGATTLVSLDSAGGQGDAESYGPAISNDGSLVAFTTSADNLVAGDLNGALDVVVRDRGALTTTLCSGTCGAFADGDSYTPAISADGATLAFTSAADDFVFDDPYGVEDVFVRSGSDPAASWNNYGAGFPGTLGVPGLIVSANPRLGASLDLDVDNSRGAYTPGFLLIGTDDASIPTPVGGTLLVDFLAIQTFVVPPFGASLPVSIPAIPAYAAVVGRFQAIEVDPGAAFGFSFTPGLELVLGG